MRFAHTRWNLRSQSGRPYDVFKRPLDVILGLGLFIVAVPVIVGAWLAVRLTSRGPGFYSQTRLGRYGKPYKLYKLRSMYHNCEAASGVRWSTKGDVRVTPVGKVIRKLHIDELPQLWNVLAGDMSLVGPRPERPEFVGPLREQVPGYVGRMAVRPGITGLAQIQLPPDTGIESVKSKLVLDLHYVERYSMSLDVRILFGTVVYVAGASYVGVRMLAALPNLARRSLEPVTPMKEPDLVPKDAFATQAPTA